MLDLLHIERLWMHLLVLLSLRTSKKVLTLKIKHIACGKVEAAYFTVCSATKSLNPLVK